MDTLMDALRSIWAFVVMIMIFAFVGLIFFAGH